MNVEILEKDEQKRFAEQNERRRRSGTWVLINFGVWVQYAATRLPVHINSLAPRVPVASKTLYRIEELCRYEQTFGCVFSESTYEYIEMLHIYTHSSTRANIFGDRSIKKNTQKTNG